MAAGEHPYLDRPRPRAFAHRGWHVDELDGQENTLPAFRRAVDEGYDYVETDVHATADGVLVTHHDATLRRLSGRPDAVRTLPWRELADVRIGGRGAIPRIEEVLEALPGVRLNVDLKSAGAVGPMLALLERDDVAARVAVASTEEARLAPVRARFGDRVVTGVSARSAVRLRARSLLPAALGGLVGVTGRMAQLPVSAGVAPVVDRWLVDTAHRAGIEVHVWTVDDAATMHRLLDLGVDGLMTDRPDVLRAVLRGRGAWAG